jgi:hypothetical protein
LKRNQYFRQQYSETNKMIIKWPEIRFHRTKDLKNLSFFFDFITFSNYLRMIAIEMLCIFSSTKTSSFIIDDYSLVYSRCFAIDNPILCGTEKRCYINWKSIGTFLARCVLHLFHSSTTNKCARFIDGECGENKNKFESKTECEAICLV